MTPFKNGPLLRQDDDLIKIYAQKLYFHSLQNLVYNDDGFYSPDVYLWLDHLPSGEIEAKYLAITKVML